MSDEIIEYVAEHTGQNRRQFVMRLLAGAAFTVPVIASFTIGGKSTPKRSPIDAGSNHVDDGPNDLDCGPNATVDESSNLCVIDDGPNDLDGGPNDLDGGSNDLDGGSNDQDSGGVGGDGGIPETL
jgi:hypothetical protein